MSEIKPFAVGRLSELSLLVSILMIYHAFGTLSFSKLQILSGDPAAVDKFDPLILNLIVGSFAIGVLGKLLETALYIGSPSSGAGSLVIPVFSIVAGASTIYLIARLRNLFWLAPDLLALLALAGALITFVSAMIVAVAQDYKRILAFLSLNQLGYAVLASGIGSFDWAIFHLLTYLVGAILLIVGITSIMISIGNCKSIFKLGGLRRQFASAHRACLIGGLSIIGLPGLTGFVSLHKIANQMFDFPVLGPYLFTVTLASIAVLSFGLLRLICAVFYGPRSDLEHSSSQSVATSKSFHFTLLIMIVLTVLIGYLGVRVPGLDGAHNKSLIESYLQPLRDLPQPLNANVGYLTTHENPLRGWLLGFGLFLIVAFGAVGALYFFINGPNLKAKELQRRFARVFRFISKRYRAPYFWLGQLPEKFYKAILALFMVAERGLSLQWLAKVVSGTVMSAGGVVSYKMRGDVRHYFMFVLFVTLLVVSLTY